MNLLKVQCCRAALPPPQARSPEGLEVLPLSSNGANAASIEYSSRQPNLSSVQVGAPPSATPKRLLACFLPVLCGVLPPADECIVRQDVHGQLM